MTRAYSVMGTCVSICKLKLLTQLYEKHKAHCTVYSIDKCYIKETIDLYPSESCLQKTYFQRNGKTNCDHNGEE